MRHTSGSLPGLAWGRRAAVLLAALLLAGHSLADSVMPYAASDTSVGTASCASSTCHGSITPWQDAGILHNEFTTWQRHDRHAQAYTVLQSEAAQRITRKLGLHTAATETPACLDCHSHNVATDKRGEHFNIADGVSCEACHGPANQWLPTHAAPGQTHDQNLAQGMYPTSKPVEQARLCLSCHVGDDQRRVTHRIMGAGHPRLSFEIDTFSSLGPAHYRLDDDWHARKGEYNPVQLWAIGQALAAQQLLNTLADAQRSRDGVFPELTLYDCHACHHAMSQRAAPSPTGSGRLRLQDSHLLMLRAIVRSVDPASADSFDQQVARLQQAAAGTQGNHASMMQQAQQLSRTIDTAIPRIEQHRFDNRTLVAILQALTQQASNNRDYADAEQAYMALSSVASYALREYHSETPHPVQVQLNQLHALLADETHYDARRFVTAVTALRDLIPTLIPDNATGKGNEEQGDL